jgi:hypothetical protein
VVEKILLISTAVSNALCEEVGSYLRKLNKYWGSNKSNKNLTIE